HVRAGLLQRTVVRVPHAAGLHDPAALDVVGKRPGELPLLSVVTGYATGPTSDGPRGLRCGSAKPCSELSRSSSWSPGAAVPIHVIRKRSRARSKPTSARSPSLPARRTKTPASRG